MLVGEDLETVLSVRSAVASMPMIAGLSTEHLARFDLPAVVRRLYVARDADRAGVAAAARLRERAEAASAAVFDLVPEAGDFNFDLRRLGLDRLRRRILAAITPEDVSRFRLTP